ncbi:MAG: DUF3874 domain-containing protein [Prevotella sp.]|nr:DUF3874 domain-containing protein [Prevotella sp.]
MKFTLIRKDNKNRTHISMKAIETFMERVKTDTKSNDVGNLRQFLKGGFQATMYPLMYKLPKVYPSAELTRDDNDNISMKTMNGILLLSIRKLRTRQEREQVKRLAMAMPSTLAAFVGSSEESVKLLVLVSRPDGTLPANEADANQFLQAAFSVLQPTYHALLSVKPEDAVPTVTSGFRMTLDPDALYNPKAVPFSITAEMASPSAQAHVGEQLNGSYDLYSHYENMYRKAVRKVLANATGPTDDNALVTEVSRQLCKTGVPQEEAVIHIWARYRYKPVQPFGEERVRAIVASVYEETSPDRRMNGDEGSVSRETHQYISYLQERYVFRYNTVMGYTEYRPNSTWFHEWQPVSDRVINGFTTDARLAGMDVWDKDVKRFVMSDKIRQFNPIDDYLFKLHSKWDGRDHIGRLAQTVPTDNANWPRWFRTWLLAMVAQWKGLNRRYGNSVAPLLISSQGYNKSTFCRSLLPEELQWGYTDNLSLDEKRPVLQAMSQMLLINLDEFNQISARTQEGFLKNIIQLARVKAKRPYGKHIEDFPRLASFIATTNMADVLADPSGNRRFIGVELTGPIDVSTRPNHEQIYAQAQALIEQGEPYWFDERETQLIMHHNRKYQLRSPAEQFFHEYFAIADDEATGEWLTAAAISERLRKTVGSSLRRPNIIAFGRMLANLEGIQRRRSVKGMEYLVRERNLS